MKEKKLIDANRFKLFYDLFRHVYDNVVVLKVCIMIDLTQGPIVHIVSINALLHQ